MLDTGKAISLINNHTRCSIDSGETTLGWSQGSWCQRQCLIPILGIAQSLSVNFVGTEVGGDFVMISTLNSEAILGLDFLEHNQCFINMEWKVLHLKGKP